MNIFEQILHVLEAKMETPKAFGWFHIMCLTIVFVVIILLYRNKKNNDEKQLKRVLGTYAFIALILEILKQLIWTFNYNVETGIVIWDYKWYAFPFQLCTTPIYVCIITLLLKKCKVRDYLLSYIAYITILGSVTTAITPYSCLVSDILVNIHTMWLHLGSLAVSVYLLMTEQVKIDKKNLQMAIFTFLIFVGIAETLNVVIYNSGLLNGEVFNMFYISPYFISPLPVFGTIQSNVPYIIYLLTYISVLILGGFIVYNVSLKIKNRKNNYKLIYYIKRKKECNL